MLAMPVANMAATYYISPGGNNNANGQTEATAVKTFAKAFSLMTAGDELILLDGMYSQAAGTGYISMGEANSAQIPSGTVSRPTVVRAKTPGAVKVIGALLVGTKTRKDSYIKIQGITFIGMSSLYNTSYVTVKDCGFYDISKSADMTFSIGTNDHQMGNSYNLIEDTWIWGSNRGIAINYRSEYNVWRRVMIRSDGCNTAPCLGEGNPNHGIVVYDSANISLQNVIVVDRILGGGSPYGDFSTAQHTDGMAYGNNEWLGCLSLNSEDIGFYLEPDEVSLMPAHRLRDCVAWDATGIGINLAMAGSNDVRNSTVRVKSGHSGIRIASNLKDGTLTNVVVLGNAIYGINSAVAPSYANVFGSWTTSAFTQTSCTSSCLTTNPLADGSIKYVTRIEPGSPLKGSGAQSADYGANIVFRYGIDGTRYGDPGYNTLTTTTLWPWPNEARIKQEMCAETGVSRGFCAKSSLTEYIWTYLGNPVPPDFTSNAPPSTMNPCDINRDGVISAADVTAARDQALGISACSTGDLEPNGRCDVIDVQRVINTVLGQQCRTGN